MHFARQACQHGCVASVQRRRNDPRACIQALLPCLVALCVQIIADISIRNHCCELSRRSMDTETHFAHDVVRQLLAAQAQESALQLTHEVNDLHLSEQT